ncbi:MAG: selenite/tellurite reduction operon rhodanese-like protein ExtH [Desulfuromonas sp.]
MKHHWKYVSKRLALLLMVLFVGTFTLTGCGSGGGSDSYSTPGLGNTAPLEGQSSNVLIDVDTLKGWIDQGYVNNADRYEKVVILQQKGYASGHIEGAQEWSVSGINRIEGPILSGNMVPDGETMDAMLQERGITANSTIVFMGNNSERIYFFFRYWGFPKNQLKILNGGTSAWTTAGYSLTTVNPVVTASTSCIKDLTNGPDRNARASLNEMIIGVEEGSIVPFATYSATSVTDAATVKETVNGGTEGYVTFQGRIDGMVQDEVLFASGAANITTGLYNTDGTYKSKAEMEAYLTSLGADGTKPIATYCRAGNLAANGFTPMDAVLDDWKIMLYDGSWSQWGSLTTRTDVVPTPAHALPEEYEEWATDWLMSEISFNYDYTDDIYQPEFYTAPLSPYDAGANNIEDDDYEYWITPPAGGGGASGPVSGGGGGC